MLPVGFVHSVQKHLAGTRIHHVDVSAVESQVAAYMHGVDVPVSFGKIPVQSAIREKRQQINAVCGVGKTVGVFVPPHCVEGKQPVIFKGTVKFLQNKVLDHIFLKRIGMCQFLCVDMYVQMSAVFFDDGAVRSGEVISTAADALPAVFIRVILQSSVGESGGEMTVI